MSLGRVWAMLGACVLGSSADGVAADGAVVGWIERVEGAWHKHRVEGTDDTVAVGPEAEHDVVRVGDSFESDDPHARITIAYDRGTTGRWKSPVLIVAPAPTAPAQAEEILKLRTRRGGESKGGEAQIVTPVRDGVCRVEAFRIGWNPSLLGFEGPGTASVVDEDDTAIWSGPIDAGRAVLDDDALRTALRAHRRAEQPTRCVVRIADATGEVRAKSVFELVSAARDEELGASLAAVHDAIAKRDADPPCDCRAIERLLADLQRGRLYDDERALMERQLELHPKSRFLIEREIAFERAVGGDAARIASLTQRLTEE